MLFVKKAIVTENQTDLLPGSGVDLDHFKPEQKPVGKFTVLMVARLLIEKGVREYIEAARTFSESGSEISFLLAGEYPADHRRRIGRGQLDHSIENKIIRYLGHVDDIREVLAQADLVVLPSYREGTPRTLLEAASMAKPLIATDVPGCREVVINDYNGYLCQPADSTDLTEKIRKMAELSQTRLEELGRNSREMAEDKFSEEKVVEKYLKVINGVYKN